MDKSLSKHYIKKLRQAQGLPRISIILPVFNGEKYIINCIDSIVQQQYQNFEIIIIDDGSTDNSINKIQSIEDKRITLISCKHNFVRSLNVGLAVSRGEFIARMDIDDKMLPNRLKEQVFFLDNNQDVTLCSSYMLKMDTKKYIADGKSGYISNFPESLLLGNPIAHPTVMIRRQFLLQNNISYKEDYLYAEDYKLWTDIANMGGTAYILPIPLLEYRISESQVSYKYSQEQFKTACKIKREQLVNLLERVSENRDLINTYSNVLSELYVKSLLTSEEFYEQIYRVLVRNKTVITNE